MPAPASTPAADTARRAPFRGAWPDSLAPAPAPGGTVQIQGQEQPARPFLTIQDQLRTVAGVQVTPYDGSPGSGNVVRIRGASVALGLAQPLYVVDGLPALNDDLTPGQTYGLTAPMPPYQPSGTYAYQPTVADQHAEAGASPLQLLPPEAIESIEVLAGPAAVARYGPLAANGVVSIRTRRGRAGGPLRVRYAAYLGVQQVRRRYDLLTASQYATLTNEAFLNNGASSIPFARTDLGTGTDWQAETYRAAGLQQHQLSLEGGRGQTRFLLSLDYRRQGGVLQNADLTRLGLRLALDQRVGARLHLRGTTALGQTDQQLPYTTGESGATRAALLAPPTQPVRTPEGDYSGYAGFTAAGPALALTNPLAVANLSYRTPRTRRLLSQLGADYVLMPHLTVQAAANFQRTLLDAESNRLARLYDGSGFGLPISQPYATQSYRTSQWGARLAVCYQQQLGARHALSAEVDYQYQAINFIGRTDYLFTNSVAGLPGGASFSGGSYEQSAELRLHRPWARVQYTFDSTLTVEAGLSYGHYRGTKRTEYYPSAQLSWQAHPGYLAVRLWLGAARTSTLGSNYPLFGPARLTNTLNLPILNAPDVRLQSPLYTDQAETGLHLSSRNGRLTGQLVAYQRTSYHALVNTQVALISGSGSFAYLSLYDEATIRNQGLELTLTADWHRGRLQGTSRLVGSLNRNRLREAGNLSPVFDNQPVGSFFGYQQNGLNANGSRRFVQKGTGSGAPYVLAVLGSGIPAQLVSLSQQLRQGRLALDAQVDGQFGYQVLNQQLDLLDTPTGYTNSATTVNDRWSPTHQSAAIPAAGRQSYDPSLSGFGNNTTVNRLLENGANVRLSSLTLTYRLRQTAAQDVSIWVGGQNLLVLTGYRGYDPNVSSGGSTPSLAGQDYGAVPVPRTWLLGVKAAF